VHGCSSSRVHRLFQNSFNSNFPTSDPARLTWVSPRIKNAYIHTYIHTYKQTNKQTNKHRKRQTAVWQRPYVFNIGQKSKSSVFRPEIPYGSSRNVVACFVEKLFLNLQKIKKTVTALRVSTNTPNKHELYLLVNFALFNSRHRKILF